MTDSNELLPLELTLAQINQVLGALGDRPYVEVHEVIDVIRRQAAHHLNPPQEGETHD